MKPRVAIIFGGKSAEHEVSLKSASNIFNAVDTSIFEPTLLGMDKNGIWRYYAGYAEKDIDLTECDYFPGSAEVYILNSGGRTTVTDRKTNRILNVFDIAFPIIHGTFGEDGTLQGFLKLTGIPFVGPDVLGSAIGMDKDVTKRLLRDAGIPVADFFVLYQHAPDQHSFEEIVSRLGLPLFVKPANAGSSVGVSRVTDKVDFDKALSEAFKYDHKILVEEAVVGKEVECAVLGNEAPKASVVGEIIPTRDFYSYQAKYIDADGARMKIPADVDENISGQIRQLAIKAFRTICCEGMARVDFFLRHDNTFVINEINTLPGFTEISMYPKLWEQTGISYQHLITELINLSLKRHERDAKQLRIKN